MIWMIKYITIYYDITPQRKDDGERELTQHLDNGWEPYSVIESSSFVKHYLKKLEKE